MTMRLEATSHPLLYEVNTRVFLRELSELEAKRPASERGTEEATNAGGGEGSVKA